jgi:hypothetical protein
MRTRSCAPAPQCGKVGMVDSRRLILSRTSCYSEIHMKTIKWRDFQCRSRWYVEQLALFKGLIEY